MRTHPRPSRERLEAYKAEVAAAGLTVEDVAAVALADRHLEEQRRTSPDR
jgi:hypothetical protein